MLVGVYFCDFFKKMQLADFMLQPLVQNGRITLEKLPDHQYKFSTVQ